MPPADNQMNRRTTEIASDVDDAEKERLEKITNSIIETITSPVFFDRMREFREKAAAGDVPLEDVAKILSTEALIEAGADIPADFRISSRTFEDIPTGTRTALRPDQLGHIRRFDEVEPLSVGGCGGAGGLTFCGCAGGST